MAEHKGKETKKTVSRKTSSARKPAARSSSRKTTAAKEKRASKTASGSSKSTRKPAVSKKRVQPVKPRLTREKISGWGRHDFSWSLAALPDHLQRLQDAVMLKEPSRRIGRGMGRAYGDAAMNDGGVAVHFNRLDRALSFDVKSGVLVAEAGITLADILHLAVPRGWFLPVTPGTSHPTLGGSIACDVHGKNHHQAGTIGAHVQWLDLVTADREVVRCSPKRNKKLFYATTGGLGLTGLIYRVALQLMKVESSYIIEESSRVGSLREMMDRLTVSDETHPYTVSWVDGVTSGTRLGQGHVLLGRHASPPDLTGAAQSAPCSLPKEGAIPVPLTPPLSLVNNLSIRAFNALRLQMAPKGGKKRIVPYRPFFYPLDAATNWNRLYGPHGFYQYQYVVPFDGAEDVLRETLKRLQKEGTLPSLIVLKRFGAEGKGMLSFPKPGWTIAIDIPVTPKLDRVLDDLDRMLVEAEGRLYLVKDARVKPDTFRKMYPRFEEWLKVKNSVDPHWTFSSNLSRRLKMEEGV